MGGFSARFPNLRAWSNPSPADGTILGPRSHQHGRIRSDEHEGTPEEQKHLALHEGIPDHLRPSLVEWVNGELLVRDENPYLSDQAMYSLPKLRGIELDLHVNLGPRDSMVGHLFAKAAADSEWFLDLLDYLLHNPTREVASRLYPFRRADNLAGILRRGGSAWSVVFVDTNVWALERQVDPTVADATIQTTTTNPTAGHHLRQAWHLAYSRSPNAGESVRESIKAVEVAAIAVISPTNATATLGSVLGEMRTHVGKGRWTVDVPPRSGGWAALVGAYGTPIVEGRLSHELLRTVGICQTCRTQAEWQTLNWGIRRRDADTTPLIYSGYRFPYYHCFPLWEAMTKPWRVAPADFHLSRPMR